MSLAAALNIVQTLVEKGFIAYFAGGWVRDYLLGTPSEEIDIATSAPPETLLALFPKTLHVGIAFGVVIVVTPEGQFEVATFRKDHAYHDGRHPVSVDYSTPEHDASRRDFTINGMFYDPLTKEIHDYVGGREDLKKGIIRAIGNPFQRFEEDRLRMLRAIRFSARFAFPIEQETDAAIARLSHSLLPAVSVERIWQELSKMTGHPRFVEAMLHMQRVGLLQTIFPSLSSLSPKEVHRRLQPTLYYPLKTPPLLFLLPLFEAREREKLAPFLKLSKEEGKRVAFFTEADLLFERTGSKRDWVYFYAHPLSSLYIHIHAAHLLPPEREAFLVEQEERKRVWGPSIERIVEKNPLLKAADLQREGILPGKKMGKLLQEGERLALEEDLTSVEEVIRRLKQGREWVDPY